MVNRSLECWDWSLFDHVKTAFLEYGSPWHILLCQVTCGHAAMRVMPSLRAAMRTFHTEEVQSEMAFNTELEMWLQLLMSLAMSRRLKGTQPTVCVWLCLTFGLIALYKTSVFLYVIFNELLLCFFVFVVHGKRNGFLVVLWGCNGMAFQTTSMAWTDVMYEWNELWAWSENKWNS